MVLEAFRQGDQGKLLLCLPSNYEKTKQALKIPLCFKMLCFLTHPPIFYILVGLVVLFSVKNYAIIHSQYRHKIHDVCKTKS